MATGSTCENIKDLTKRYKVSHKCNRFLIRNNKFIRDFETMYQHFNDPWDQRQQHESDLLNNGALYFLSWLIKKESIKINGILDLGCADGYFAEHLLALSQEKLYTISLQKLTKLY